RYTRCQAIAARRSRAQPVDSTTPLLGPKTPELGLSLDASPSFLAGRENGGRTSPRKRGAGDSARARWEAHAPHSCNRSERLVARQSLSGGIRSAARQAARPGGA